MDDRYYVETPEVVTIAYDLAGAGSRCLAAAVDTLLILLLQAALGALILAGASLLADPFSDGETLLIALWSVLAFTLLWGYYLLFELVWSGQSPGKRLFGLRVLREGGRPIDFSASALRNLLRAVDFLPFAYGLGVVVIFGDPRARRLGDLAAGTVVVREGVPLTLDEVARGAAPAPVPPRAADAPPVPLLPNLHAVGPEVYTLAEELLRRRSALAPARRAALAAELTALIRGRLGLPPGGDPERFLEHFVREYRVYRAPEQFA
ncbi:MAG: RDD family protein [Chloroflexi bacterium OHK40]